MWKLLIIILSYTNEEWEESHLCWSYNNQFRKWEKPQPTRLGSMNNNLPYPPPSPPPHNTHTLGMMKYRNSLKNYSFSSLGFGAFLWEIDYCIWVWIITFVMNVSVGKVKGNFDSSIWFWRSNLLSLHTLIIKKNEHFVQINWMINYPNLYLNFSMSDFYC